MSDQPNARDVIAAALDADPELRDAIANLEPGTPEGDRADAVMLRMFALPGAAEAVDRLGGVQVMADLIEVLLPELRAALLPADVPTPAGEVQP